MKDYAQYFYSSKRWQDCRNAYKRSVSYLCEDCMDKGIVKAGTEVHHVIPITQHNINNLFIIIVHFYAKLKVKADITN